MPSGSDSNLLIHAERELDLAGMGDPDADYDGALKPAVLEIIGVFAEQGHSGMSAAMTTNLVERGSFATITFPYVPGEPERVPIDAHGRALDGSGRDLRGFCDDDGCGCWHSGREG